MPTAREALLDAALAALERRSWSAVRMADLAVAARVSRQTLYNEFGSKEGLARALVRREADAYLLGVRRLLAAPAPPERNLAVVAEWIVTRAASRPVLRALLTGSWDERLPAPRPARPGARPAAVPAQRRADEGRPRPASWWRRPRPARESGGRPTANSSSGWPSAMSWHPRSRPWAGRGRTVGARRSDRRRISARSRTTGARPHPRRPG